MDAVEFKSIRKGLGFSQAEFAFALNLSKNGGRTVRRYESNALPVTGPVKRLCEIYRDHPALALSFLSDARLDGDLG